MRCSTCASGFYSTSDMKRWTAHDPIMKVTDFHWAKKDAWASQVIRNKGRYWLYAAVEHIYDWRDGIGPRDRRPESWKAATGGSSNRAIPPSSSRASSIILPVRSATAAP